MIYDFDIKKYPFTCLPAGLDRSNLVDVTPINHGGWRTFIDTVSGETHDCEIYHNAFRQQELTGDGE
jgi:hypothetical protein